LGPGAAVVAEVIPVEGDSSGSRGRLLDFPTREAGYVLEGTMRRSAIKNGESKDQALFAFVRNPADDPPGFLDGHGP